MSFRCPVCSQELKKERKIWVCPQGHTFDIAAKGYVNLLMSNSSGAKPEIAAGRCNSSGTNANAFAPVMEAT